MRSPNLNTWSLAIAAAACWSLAASADDFGSERAAERDVAVDVDGEQTTRDANRTTDEGRAAQSRNEQNRNDQQRTDKRERTSQQANERMQRVRGAMQARFDEQLAESLAWGNQAEVAISQLAAKRATNEQVRQFAQKMVTTHEDMLESLTEYAAEVTDIREHTPGQNAADARTGYGKQAPNGRSAADAEGTSEYGRDLQQAYRPENDREGMKKANRASEGLRSEAKNADRVASEAVERADDATNPSQSGQAQKNGQAGNRRRARANGQQAGSQQAGGQQRSARRMGQKPSSMEDVWADAAAICLKRTMADIEERQGLDFDWAYIWQQRAAHTKMLSELEAMQNRGSSRFNQLVAQGVAKTRSHLKELDELVETLEQAEEQKAQQN